MRYVIWLINVRFKVTRYFDYIYNKAVFFVNKINAPVNNINGRVFVKNKGLISIGNNFKANSGKNKNPIGGDGLLRFIVDEDGELEIGDNVGISNSTFFCCERISIDDYVYIGGGCRLWDTNFHSLDPYERLHNGDKKVNTAPIKIKKYVFIGGGSIILKGVTIGEYSVIGAGSVVVKSVPDREIWGGNPARFIRKIEIKERQPD